MKVGDTVPVVIAGQTVTQASVKELGDGTATLVVPATLVVMAVRTELALAPEESTTAPEEGAGGAEHVVLGVEERQAASVVETNTDASQTPTEPAVVVRESAEIDASDAIKEETTAPVEPTVTDVKPAEVPEETSGD